MSKLILHEYQRVAAKFILAHPYAALFADPGMGKTSIILAVISHLLKQERIQRALVIAPLIVCHNVWPREKTKWDQFAGLTMSILHGAEKKEKLKREAEINVINPEGLEWLVEQPEMKNFDMLIIDESSKFKNATTKRFKRLKPLLNQFSRRVIMSGTPAPRSLIDLYSQIFILDKGKMLGSNISIFRKNYCQQIQVARNVFVWDLKPSSERKIKACISPICLHLDAESNLDLPKLLLNKIETELPATQQKEYKDFEKQFFARIENQNIISPTAGAAYGKCCQMANGTVYDADGNSLVFHDEKIQALENLIEELQGKPVLIGYRFRHDGTRIKARLNRMIPEINGQTSQQDRAKYIDAWNEGKTQILLAQIQSVSHGLNLQGGGNDVVFFSLVDSLDDYDQFIRRVYRQGVVGTVRVHHIIARDTVDEAIMYRLEKKEKTQDALLSALKLHHERQAGKVQ
jgi:SNF2 family DNA or RNA helicase